MKLNRPFGSGSDYEPTRYAVWWNVHRFINKAMWRWKGKPGRRLLEWLNDWAARKHLRAYR